MTGLCLSILGGIQPGPLATYIRSATRNEEDDGFVSRFQLAVYPDEDKPFVWVDRWPDKDAKNRAYAVFKALDDVDVNAIGAMVDDDSIPFLRFDDDAQGFFVEWFADLENNKLRAQESSQIESHPRSTDSDPARSPSCST